MIAFWVSVAAIAFVAGLWLARPFLTGAKAEVDETEAAISIFRDQSAELEKDLEANLIGQYEYDAARAEIEKRVIASAQAPAHLTSASRSPVAAVALTAACALGALVTYAAFGSPESEDQPRVARQDEVLQRQASSGDMMARIEMLIQKTRKNPKSFEDWWMLALSYATIADHASASEAYRQAAKLSSDRPAVLSAYAESLTLANANKVTEEARLIFEQILQKSPDPRARYYIALAKAQANDLEGALDDWAALARSSRSDAPWMAHVRRQIIKTSELLKRDAAKYLPEPEPTTVTAGAGGGAKLDPAAAKERAKELADKLAASPKDYKGWLELARLYVQLGQTDDARAAIGKVRELYGAAPFVVARINETANQLGLDGAAEAGRVKGPSAADMAAARSMSPDAQAQMIEGMVAGLAAKLEKNPDNSEGWMMLIRSYTVLGRKEQALAAYEKARSHFAGNHAVLAQMKQLVEGHLNIK